MSKQSFRQAQTVKSPGPTRSGVSLLDRQHTLGPHLCVQHDATAPTVHPGAPSLVRDVVGSPGQPLDAATRSFMEPRFGRDFSQVRVHTDGKAAESADAVSANAYTVGRSVVFANQRYAPATRDGKRLLAHELTHVVQQQATTSSRIQPSGRITISDSDDRSERVADQIADHVTSEPGNRSVKPSSLLMPAGKQSGFQLQRQPNNQGGSFKPHKGGPLPDPMAGHHVPSSDVKAADVMPAETDAEEAWGEADVRIRPEFENAFQDLTRAAAADAKWQVRDLVQPYDGSLSDPNKTFLAVAGAFLGGAGNFPQDPPPKTAEIAAKYTVSVTGGLSGIITQGMQGALGILLDTGSIQDVKETASLNIEEIMANELTLDSPAYGKFESGEIAVMQDVFFDLWDMRPPDRRTKTAATHLAERFREMARTEYGVHGERGQKALDQLGTLLHTYLESKVKPQLRDIKAAQQNRRLLTGTLAGGASGLIVGGAVGYALGGSAGMAALGGAIGLGAGALAGLAGGAITNAASSSNVKETEDAATRRRNRIKGRKTTFTDITG